MPLAAIPQANHKKRHTEQKHIESDLQRSHFLKRSLIDSYNIYSIRKRRSKHKCRAHQTQRSTVAALIQQTDAAQGKHHAQGQLPRQLLLIDKSHNQRHHDRVDKQQGRGNAHVHVVVALEQRERRYGHQQSHHDEREDLPALQPEVTSACLQHDAQQGDGEQISVEQHRIGIHSRLVKGQGKQRVHAIRCRRHCSQKITFRF